MDDFDTVSVDPPDATDKEVHPLLKRRSIRYTLDVSLADLDQILHY